MDVQIERERLNNEATQLLLEAEKLSRSEKLDKSTRARIDVLLASASQKRQQAVSLQTDEELRARAAAAASDKTEERVFEAYLRKGKGALTLEEQRSLTTDPASAGYLIAAQWAGGYISKLKSYSGIREAGATIKKSNSAAPMLWPVSDDTANTGLRVTEASQPTLTNPIASLLKLAGYSYSSQGVIISNSLVEDLGFDLSSYLQDIFGKRVGRITNTEFSLGAVGGPSGVIPNLTVSVTTASPTAVLLSELTALIASVDPAYRQPEADPVFMFSAGVESTLKSMTGSTSGLKLFPEMDEGKLLGYRYVLNTDMAPALASTAKTVVFGSLKHGVVIREADPYLIASRERYAELSQSYYILYHRQDCQVSDANALKLLQMHA